MVGARFAERWGPITGVLVKLLSPAGQVPLHAHPTRAWARQHLGSPFGKTEAWILLDTPGDGAEPAYAGVGFQPGIDRDWFAAAVRRHDNAAIRGTLHRTEVHPGEVYVAHAGRAALPRAADLVHRGPGAERPHRDPGDVRGRRRRGHHGPGLGPGPRHDRLHAARTPGRRSPGPGSSRGCCAPATPRARCACSPTTCSRSSTPPRWRSTDEIEVSDGRFSIAIVTSGTGSIEGDFGRLPVRRGETFALPASLAFRAARRARTSPCHPLPRAGRG